MGFQPEPPPFPLTQPLTKRRKPRKFSRDVGLQDATPQFGAPRLVSEQRTIFFKNEDFRMVGQAETGTGYFLDRMLSTIGTLTRHPLTLYGNGPGDHFGEEPIASHSSWVRNFLGFKAPVA